MWISEVNKNCEPGWCRKKADDFLLKSVKKEPALLTTKAKMSPLYSGRGNGTRLLPDDEIITHSAHLLARLSIVPLPRIA